MTTVVGSFCVGVGLLMAGWWAFEVGRGALTRPDRRPVEIRLHVGAELATAGLLVAGGVDALVADGRSVALVALGMLLYSVVQSPGYFLARHERGPAAMFAALAALTGAAIGLMA